MCEFLAGNQEYEHVRVGETPHAVAFLNRYPTQFGALIVAPKEHHEQATGDFTENEYLELQRFIYQVSEAMRHVLAPERVYVLSLGSKAANSHVHWHIVPLPPGVPLAHQQYHALMHEHGVIEATDIELQEYVMSLNKALHGASPFVGAAPETNTSSSTSSPPLDDESDPPVG